DNTITAGGESIALSGAGSTSGDIVDGNDVSINSSSSYVTLTGTSDTFSGSGNMLDMDTGSAATLTNGSDTIDMQTGASLFDDAGSGNDTIDASAGDTIQVNNDGGSSYLDTINASGDAGITLDSGSSLDMVGLGNTIATSSSDDLTAGGDTIDAASGQTLSLTDSGDVQNTVDGTGFTISQSNGSLAFDGSGTLNGSGVALEIDANSKGTVTSSDDAIDMDGGATLIDSAGDGNDTINASAGDTIQISNDGGSSYLDTINANGDAGITLDAGSSLDLVGSGNAVAANNGDQITATDNTIDANNASLTLT
ncbi:hypothetical protein ISP15_18160, partial [Dyella jejuensis]